MFADSEVRVTQRLGGSTSDAAGGVEKVMVVPFAHIGDLPSLPTEVAADVMWLTQRAISAIKEEYRPQGFNVGINLGEVAGGSVSAHLHVHVVPRTKGDGLRGFFWPRTKYDDGEAAEYGEKLRAAIA